MVSYWTNFAVTGNPNGGALPTWSLYNPTVDIFQSLIPPTPTTESTFNTDHMCDSFWNLIRDPESNCDFWGTPRPP